MQDATSLPQDLAACQQLIAQLSAQLQERDAQLEDRDTQLRDRQALLDEQAQTVVAIGQAREDLQQENETLQLTIDKLLRQLYGNRRERVIDDPHQQLLDFGDDPQAADMFQDAMEEAEQIVEDVTNRRKAKRRRRRREKFPEHLPRVEKFIDVSEEEKLCPTHGERKLIGYDETETLKMKRPELYVEVTKYPKYVCEEDSQCGVLQAERPTGLVAGNRFDTSVATEIITAKYAYHLPFYRQQDLFAGCGWTPSRSTLLNILSAAEFVLQPLADYYRKLLLESTVIGCDETPVRLIVPPVLPAIDPRDPRSQRIHEVLRAAQEKNAPSVKGRMWAYRSLDIPVNVFDFTVSRHRDGPDEILSDYAGKLLGDCWSGFQKIDLRSDGRIVRGACWSHARRKVFDGRTSQPQQASVLLALIRQLYDIEDRGKLLSAEARLELRRRESLPLLEKIRAYLDSDDCARVLPKSVFAEALGYLRNHWEALLLYTTDALMPIDNNDVEQLMKQVALGRKNWLFLGSVAAGNRAATLLTLISTAVRNDLDVWAYLKDVLDQLLAGTTDYAPLQADVWKQTHPQHIRVYRADERREASDRRRYARAQRRVAQAKSNSTS
jgi:transposase